MPRTYRAAAEYPDDVMVALEGVSKTFRLHRTQTIRETIVAAARRKKLTDSFSALNDVSFTVERGESIALLGLNGSGKSTTLKMISGVLTPTAGRVWTRGRVAGLIEVGAGFHPDLSGRENVYLNAAILGMDRDEIDERFDEIVEFSGIERFIDTEVKHYSSGMFIRLAFSVAIHTHADVLLVDEVLSVGDAPFQEKCLAKIAEVQQAGTTLVIVSHDLATVRSVCDRGIVMRDGEIIFDGSIDGAVATFGPLPRVDDREVFRNPIGGGADPWVIRHEKSYLWSSSIGDRAIAVTATDRLTNPGVPTVVWQAPDEGPVSRQIWAPELHRLDGRWYIYFAASDGRNQNHLSYVLESSGDDPFGPYELHGPLQTGDVAGEPVWAIDLTVLERGGLRYAVWSGWDRPGSDRQYLYIARLATPTQLAGARVRIAENAEHPWEETDEPGASRGLAEGPEVFSHGGRTFLTYSCGASWLPSYKVGMLELIGDDPLSPDSWRKADRPLLESAGATFGVGHGCFVASTDGSQTWYVYHAKLSRTPGWERVIFAQPVAFDGNGAPSLGPAIQPAEAHTRPQGERLPELTGTRAFALNRPAELRAFGYYGDPQLVELAGDGLHLGVRPAEPVNMFSSGEKVVLAGGRYSDFTASVTMELRSGRYEAGLLLRVSQPTVGYDGHQGYFVGVIGTGRLLIGLADGRNWRELKRTSLSLADGVPVQLEVTAAGPTLVVTVNGESVIDIRDDTYRVGSVGLRVTDSHAVFRDLKVVPFVEGASAAVA